MTLHLPGVQEHLPPGSRGILWVIALLWGLQSDRLYSCQPWRKDADRRRAGKTAGSLCYFRTSKEALSLSSLKSASLKAVQLVWQRPLGFDSKPEFVAVLSVPDRCKNLSVSLTMRVECLTVPYVETLSKTREFDSAAIFSDGEEKFYSILLSPSRL